MAHCEDCGNKIGHHGCEWCNEELYILDQYDDLQGTEFEIPYPSEDSEFMKKVRDHHGSR